jgi:hypothetical protein
MDRPRRGFIQVNQASLTDLAQFVDAGSFASSRAH